jgi:hypothetical protein
MKHFSFAIAVVAVFCVLHFARPVNAFAQPTYQLPPVPVWGTPPPPVYFPQPPDRGMPGHPGPPGGVWRDEGNPEGGPPGGWGPYTPPVTPEYWDCHEFYSCQLPSIWSATGDINFPPCFKPATIEIDRRLSGMVNLRVRTGLPCSRHTQGRIILSVGYATIKEQFYETNTDFCDDQLYSYVGRTINTTEICP